MRKLIVTENMSLDGVIDAAGDWFGPADGGDDLLAVMREHDATADAVLLGRKTYAEFASYWPLQTDDTTGITDYLNRTQKYVVSSTLARADWQNSTLLPGPLADEIDALKRQPGQDIVATGSIALVHGLAGARLVDTYRLFVFPVVVGRGRQLFPEGSAANLKLTDTRTFRSGIVLLTYQVVRADEVRTVTGR